MKLKFIIGLLLSLLLVWLSLRGIDIEEVYHGLQRVNGIYVLYSMVVMILMQVLRAIRWGLILKPLDEISKFTIFSITNVGFLAIVSIPARLGELVKPYLISRNSRISMGSALGTIFIERVLDIIAVFIIAAAVFSTVPLPAMLSRYGLTLFLLTIFVILSALLIFLRKDKAKTMIAPFLKMFPIRYVSLMEKLMDQFRESFKVVKNPALLITISFTSLFIWLADALAIYLFFLAFHFDLPITAAFIIMVILIAGIAIPSAPGFIGNWHYACVLGLSLYQIAKTSALSFAILYHAISIGIIIILGLVFLPFNSAAVVDFWRTKNS
jgi:uncharacterized protein (TIRG00374 family)